MASLNGNKQELTPEQLQIIATEIIKNEYQDVTSGGICKVLIDKSLIANPEPQGTIDGLEIELMEMLEIIGATLQNVNNIRAHAEGEKVWNILKDLDSLDLNSTLVTDCFDKLLSEGLLSQAKIDTILALGQIPDPNWQAQILGESKTEELLGVGYMVESKDIRAAQAL